MIRTPLVPFGVVMPFLAAGPTPAGCPVHARQPSVRDEPPDAPDRELAIPHEPSAVSEDAENKNEAQWRWNPLAPKPQQDTGGCPVSHTGVNATDHNNISTSTSDDPHDIVPATKIPASGRGNSGDGQHWVNPSANQLYRALKRNNKPIDHDDSLSVSFVHTVVTEKSWECVMEYENLHKSSCSNPTLARFQGMDGIYSYKAKFVHFMGWADLPFDRHDWIVDRCGKEVRYIIDYYASQEDDGVAYHIDARPAPTLGGLKDRIHLALKNYWNGRPVW